ncbi:hypothetical protein EDC04DRAFT_2612177 [Pisolithus marmoratus]|nr:hypothetical protein EDC04DRAFT_2612177 [Pisolithus marmoratus]
MSTCTAPILVTIRSVVCVIEREPQHRRGQRGPAIQPRTFEVFHFLQIPKIHEHATPFLPMQEHNRGSLNPLHMFLMVEHMEPMPEIPYAIVHEHLAKFGCTIELGTELVSFTQDEKCVRAKVVKHCCDDGKEVEEDIEAAYLIGADGTRGMTRKQLRLTFLGTTREHDFMVVGDIHLQAEDLDQDHWHFFGQMSQDVITLHPTDELGKDGWQIIMSSCTNDLQGLIHNREAFVNCINEFIGLGDDIKVKEVVWASEFRWTRPNMRTVMFSPEFRCCPFNLTWKIALVYKSFSPASLLDTYAAERLPVIAEMLGYTTKMHKLMFDESGTGCTPPSIADDNETSKNVKSNLECGMRCGKNMFMLGVNYHTSLIVIDDLGVPAVQLAYEEIQEGILQAGDHAPDAPGLISYYISHGSQSAISLRSKTTASTHMFDIFTLMHHTVIVFTPAFIDPFMQFVLTILQQVVPKELVRGVVVLPGSSSQLDGSVKSWISSKEDQAFDVEVLVNQAGHAYRGYIIEGQETKVVVVCPDGVVGAVMHGVMGLVQYFEGIFGKKGGMLTTQDAVQI